MQKSCQSCGKLFVIEKGDLEFYDKISPNINGEKFLIPEPIDCASCRRKHLLAFWPYGILQKRKCDFSGENIISTYSPDCRFPVYKRDHWFSDKWEALSMDIDFEKSFFDQFYELQCKTPHFHQLGKNNENCDYADDVWDCKNAYLSRSMAACEDVYYVYRNIRCHDCIDITYCYDMEKCYECTYCWNGFNQKFSHDCTGCSDSWFLYDCRGCNSCFMCWNLRNKSYHILNKAYSKEDFESLMKSFDLGSRKSLEKFKKEFRDNIKKQAVHKHDFNLNTQNCSGNYITNCKNCNGVFFLEDSEDCSYVFRCPSTKNCQDMVGLYRGELSYQITQSTDLNRVSFGIFSVDCHDSMYIDQCFNSSNLFGCVGLKRKEYCILNKQYSKEDYAKLVGKLIKNMQTNGEWGKFFQYRFAYNGFNLSLGSFYYDETEKSISEKGGFFEKEPPISKTGIDAKTLPDHSIDIVDDVIGKPINCADTGKTYTFIKQELDFYRRHNIPLPIYYPEKRNTSRFKTLVPTNQRKVECLQCKKTITTYYPEDWEYEKILCEDCYLKAVY